MGLMSRLTDWLNGPEERSLIWPGYPGYDVNLIAGQLFGIPFQQTLKGQKEEIPATYEGFVEQAYKSNAVVFACMRARQSLFSEARFRFRRVRNGKPGDLFGTQGLRILEEPWPGAMTGDLLSIAITDYDTGGGAFLVRRGNAIRRLRPSWTTFIAGGGQIGDVDVDVIGYVYHPGGRGSGREPVTFQAEEVAYWQGPPDPTSQFRGLPWLAPVIREIVGDSATTNHKLNFFENGATPNLAITLDADISLTDAKEWIELFKQDHEGAFNAYKTLFLGGGAKPVPVGSSLKDIDYKAIQGAGETRIAAAAGVPPIVVGLSEGLASATYSNYGQARRAFADLTMRPLWRSFAGALATIIDVPSDAELWYDDADISFLQEDVKDAAEIISINGATINGFLREGWEPESAKTAVISGDLSQLKHTGMLSVQLQPPGTEPPEPPEQLKAKPVEQPLLTPGRSEEIRCPGCDKLVARSLGPGTDFDCPRCKTAIIA